MKILLVAIAGIVAIILAILVIGLLLPKRHVVSRSAQFRATPERLFTLIDGPQNWRPDVIRCEVVPEGQQRSRTIGTTTATTIEATTAPKRIRETTRNGETIEYEVIDSVPPTSIKRRIATKNLPYSGTWTYTLQPEGETTRVEITEDGEVYNPIFRFVSRFLIGETRTMDAYLRNLGNAVGQEVEIHD